MRRGIPRIAPQRHKFVRAQQRAQIAAKKGLTVQTDKNYRAPKIKGMFADPHCTQLLQRLLFAFGIGIKTRRPGDIEETKIHSWQVWIAFLSTVVH